MDGARSPYVQMVQDCEAAIIRIRAAIRAGTADSPPTGDDLIFIQRAVQGRFIGFARRLRWISDQAVEEARQAMDDRLFDDIWSLTFPSLETGFGSYLQHMPLRMLQNTARNYRSPDVSLLIEHLDDTVGEDGMQRYELIEDDDAQAAFAAIGDNEEFAEALASLSTVERQVIAWRLQTIDNTAIARRLGVSPPTATRLYQRGVQLLRQRLNPTEE